MKKNFCFETLVLALSLFLVGATQLAPVTHAEDRPAAVLKYSEACILQAVAAKMNVTLRPDVPVPEFFVESKTPLKQFQDAIEPQWGFRPDSFLNAYVLARNEIYLLDELKYYEENDRFIDDSLAHELTHFIQVRYQGADLFNDDSLEYQAIDVQTWFRETYARPNAPISADCVPSAQ